MVKYHIKRHVQSSKPIQYGKTLVQTSSGEITDMKINGDLEKIPSEKKRKKKNKGTGVLKSGRRNP